MHANAPGTSGLDYFRRCAIDGCPWRVHLPETRCVDHGGRPLPQYAEGADGEILDFRHMPARGDAL